MLYAITAPLIIAHILLSIVSLFFYPGSSLVYMFFSASYLALIFHACKSKDSPSYFYLGLLLWLGFFLKTSCHVILSYPFSEGTGLFSYLPNQWDDGLIVSSIAAVSMVATKQLLDKIFPLVSPLTAIKKNIPGWYIRNRRPLLIGYCISIFFITVSNSIFGIQITGIAPSTVLPWHLNIFVSWLLYFGVALGISLLSCYEISLSNGSTKSFILFLFEGITISISTLSRGYFVYQMIPYFHLNILNQKIFKTTPAIIFKRIIIFGILLFGSFFAITALRSANYSLNIPRWQNYDVKASFVTRQFMGVVVDRWIGIEGALALSSYPDKSFSLFFANLEKGPPKPGQLDSYEEISKSVYANPANPISRNKKFVFSSLPGIVGFLLYSGSKIFLALSILLIVFALKFVDHLVYTAFGNLFLSALIGFFLANTFAQFGPVPRQNFIPLLIIFFSLIPVFILTKRNLL